MNSAHDEKSDSHNGDGQHRIFIILKTILNSLTSDSVNHHIRHTLCPCLQYKAMVESPTPRRSSPSKTSKIEKRAGSSLA
mmetsp:Transcript_9325/g.21036  ORF Transcript_9325/g.21036 Transcript_9325/m.21036 type:complete len:80 (+) Transcript_9325:388-627(+)